MSEIRITGIRAVGYHGVFEEERREGQEFIVDVLLKIDTSAAEKSDQLSDSVDYGAVAITIKEFIVGPAFNLIEALAARIAETLLKIPTVELVEVTVHKPQAPIPLDFTDVSVTVARSK